MKVGELKKKLDQFSNDMEVVLETSGPQGYDSGWKRNIKVERVMANADNMWDETDTEQPAVLLS